MLDEMENAPDIIRPSAYWEVLNDMNLRQLSETGFPQFKRTVNGNYFQWLPCGPRDPQFRAVFLKWLVRPSTSVLRARITDAMPFMDTRVEQPFRSPLRRAGYAFFVAAFWEYCHATGQHEFGSDLEEPALGNPLTVTHDGRQITQDLCNSALELNSILSALPSSHDFGNGVVELGGGYGRLAWLFLREMPEIRYFMVDIPPALALAERYLTEIFPDRSVFRFRQFRDYAAVQEEFETARIGFLMPHQLELIPPFEASLFINISSLHEMPLRQISHYLRQIDHHCSGFFYTKQSIESVNPYDNVVIRQKDYPIPATWSTVFERRHPVQTQFFEALYRVKAGARQS